MTVFIRIKEVKNQYLKFFLSKMIDVILALSIYRKQIDILGWIRDN